MNDGVALSPRLPGQEASEPLDIDALIAGFRGRTARIGIIGLGYVGLPLLRAAAERGFSALGFDIDRSKVELLNAGGSYLGHIGAASIAALRQTGHLARAGRGGQPDREPLACGPHRPRQRAEDRLQRDGHRYLGGDRGGQDQALRLYAVLPRPRAWRALHPDRSVLPGLEGAGIRN